MLKSEFLYFLSIVVVKYSKGCVQDVAQWVLSALVLIFLDWPSARLDKLRTIVLRKSTLSNLLTIIAHVVKLSNSPSTYYNYVMCLSDCESKLESNTRNEISNFLTSSKQ